MVSDPSALPLLIVEGFQDISSFENFKAQIGTRVCSRSFCSNYYFWFIKCFKNFLLS